MPSVEKLIAKMHEQPNGIRMAEAEKVLIAYGYYPVRQKGSHKHFLNSKTGDLITIKNDTPLKKVYTSDILNRIGK
jgi:predicted RNA binding protein YcfA (HicA-like mRNA interferase family)